MKIYRRYLKKYKHLFALAIMFLAFEATADLLQPLLISKIIDQGVKNSDLTLVIQLSGVMFLVALFGLLSALSRNYLSTHVSFNFAKNLRKALYDQLLKMDMMQVESIERGSIINRLTFDVRQMQLFVNGTMRIFLKAPFLAIGSFIMVLSLDKRFMLIYLSILPVMLLVIFINMKYGYPKLARIQVKLDHLNKKTIEYLNGIRVVKAFNRSVYENENFEKVSDELKSVSTNAMQFMAVFNPIIMLAANMAIVVLLFLGKDWVFNGEISVGQIVAFINYMTQLMFATSVMSRVFAMYIRAKTSNDRIEEVFDTPVFQGSREEIIPNQDLTQALRIKHLSFRYGQGEKAIDNITFELKPNESIGIIGTTGSGKTTLINLIMGILNTEEGEIYLGNTRISEGNLKAFRSQLGYVPQEKILFSNTVKENVTFGSEDPSDLKAILNLASADFVDQMKDQENSWLGKGGVNISGGQKQRLSIARALMKKPRILILDDATSALDAVTEKKVMDQLMAESKSLLVIGQKISTVKRMDKILVMDKGKMVGFDTHDNLLNNNKTYQEIFEAQMGGSQ